MATRSSREEQIEKIIKGRESSKNDVIAKQERLRNVGEVIRQLEELRKQIIKDGPASIVTGLMSIDLDSLLKKIEQEILALEKPKSRFSRTTLNIGVIGRTGQGKSRLLQSLSSLGPEVIPTGSGSFCTGVRSLIRHDDDVKKEGGEIHFYEEQEFLHDVLAPYYQRLQLNQGVPPANLNSFATDPLPPLNGHVNLTLSPLATSTGPGYISSGEMYRHLKEYREHVQVYRPFINKRPLPIPIQQVREYVAQDSPDGNTKYYNHMAVKEAIVTRKFPSGDVGKIALLDMPGLGDTGVGDDLRLLQALEEHIDIVLFVLMPSSKRGVLSDVDFGLYDLAYYALNGIPIKEWSFMVLNHTRSSSTGDDNYANCVRIKKQIDSRGTGIGDRNIGVIQCIIADCTEKTEAQEQVLEQILNHLASDMSRLDSMYMSTWDNRRAQLKAEIVAELAKARRLAAIGTSQYTEEKMFDTHFEALWRELAIALEILLKQLEQEKEKPNQTFVKYFKDTFDTCRKDTGVPDSAAIIEELRHAEGDYATAFSKSLHHMRTHLMHQFIDIDEKLQDSMQNTKKRVADIFLQQGELQPLMANLSSHQIFTYLAKQENLSSHLQETLQAFDRYQLSLRGAFQSIIHNSDSLNNLHPDKTTYTYLSPRFERLPMVLPGIDHTMMELLKTCLTMFLRNQSGGNLMSIVQALPNLDRDTRATLASGLQQLFFEEQHQKVITPKPEELLKALKDAQKEAVDTLEKRLKNFVFEPGKAAFAAVEEFVDQALRSREARRDWRIFYVTNKANIWSAEFGQIIRWQKYARDWQGMVQSTLEAVQYI